MEEHDNNTNDVNIGDHNIKGKLYIYHDQTLRSTPQGPVQPKLEQRFVW